MKNALLGKGPPWTGARLPATIPRTMNRGRIPALFGAAVLYFVALYAYVPGLPAYVAERTSSLAAVGVVLSMYGLWMAVLRMPLGIVTDATGRTKPYLVGGVLLAGAGAGLGGAAVDAEHGAEGAELEPAREEFLILRIGGIAVACGTVAEERTRIGVPIRNARCHEVQSGGDLFFKGLPIAMRVA